MYCSALNVRCMLIFEQREVSNLLDFQHSTFEVKLVIYWTFNIEYSTFEVKLIIYWTFTFDFWRNAFYFFVGRDNLTESGGYSTIHARLPIQIKCMRLKGQPLPPPTQNK